MKGKLITNPQRLIELAKDKKSIWCDWTTDGYRIPAAVIINWQLHLVMKAINEGALYEYVKENKKKPSFHSAVKQYPLLPKESYKNIIGKDEENE